MGWVVKRHDPAALPPANRHVNHFTGGWVGPTAGLDRSGQSRNPPPRTGSVDRTACSGPEEQIYCFLKGQ